MSSSLGFCGKSIISDVKLSNAISVIEKGKYTDEFIGKVFPVIVSVVTKNSTILVTPRQFKEYDIPFPDSLQWVIAYAKD